MPTTCITNSVTLQAGESFILPPGATIIGTSVEDAIESTCDLPDLETPECYVFDFVTSNQDLDASDAYNYDPDVIDVVGLRIKGVTTSFILADAFDHYTIVLGTISFNAGISATTTDLKTRSSSLFMSTINASMCHKGASNKEGIRITLCFKTIPSIGDDSYLILRPQWTESGIENDIYIKARKYSSITITTANGCEACNCPTI